MSMFYVESVGYADQAARGGCYTCLRDHGGLVDMDMLVEGEGRLILCAKCLSAAAAILGFTTPDVSTRLAQENADLHQYVRTLTADLERKHEIITSQSRALTELFSPDDPDPTPYTCEVEGCGYTGPSQHALKVHIGRAHPATADTASAPAPPDTAVE